MNKKNKIDLRVIKTKKLIKDSFIQLIEENGYSKVTVTDIVNKALINRNTFYLHYLDKEDLIDEILLENYKNKEPQIKKILTKHVLENLNDPIKMQEMMLKDIFEQLLEEIELYRIFIMDPGLNGYLNKLKNNIKNQIKIKTVKSLHQQTTFEFIFEGAYGVIIEWIKNDYTTKDKLASELAHLLNSNWKLIFENENLINLLNQIK